jgi:hypothetical protein
LLLDIYGGRSDKAQRESSCVRIARQLDMYVASTRKLRPIGTHSPEIALLQKPGQQFQILCELRKMFARVIQLEESGHDAPPLLFGSSLDAMVL